MKLDQESRMTIRCMAKHGERGRKIARLLGVSEGTVRYHLRRGAAVDGRSLQKQVASDCAEAIEVYIRTEGEGPVNLADLHDWLVYEHDYRGSLRSVQRYFRRHYPKPRRRARRRVETPPGAQGHADWAEWPRVQIGGRLVYAYEFHLRLSHSRFGARVWSPKKDHLSWQAAHNGAFRRLEGIPATVRVDNEKTAMSRGAGPWGEANASYRRYAKTLRFHIDACLPRSPQAKGKVERGIRNDRRWREVTERPWSSWDELQSWTDERMVEEASRRICPVTGTSVREAWEAEKRWLVPLPLLPEPFDLAVNRPVHIDCLVAFEGRQYSVPFAWAKRRVEVRGCACHVQVYAGGAIMASHPRHTRERLVIDPSHYEGASAGPILPPVPLGKMGRRLQEIAAMAPEKRPLDLYAALAEVAR